MIINLYSAHVQKYRATTASGIDEDMGFSGELPSGAADEKEAQR